MTGPFGPIIIGPAGRLPEAPECPGCHRRLDGYTPVGHLSPPEAGDRTMCVYCRTFAVYESAEDGTLSLRLATPTETAEMRARFGGGSL